MPDTGARGKAEAAMDALGAFITAADPNLNGESLARTLIGHACSPAQVYETDANDLCEMPGMSRTAAQAVDLIDSLCRYVERERFGKHPPLTNFSKAAAYLKTLFIGVNLERCYLLCLDANARLIACKLIQEGTIDRSAIYMRTLAETALRTGATYAVLSHNHPGGSETPSAADIDTTVDALDAMTAIGTVLLDHVIVAGGTAVSMRTLGLPAERAWLSQHKGDSILGQWNEDKRASAKPERKKAKEESD